MKKSSLLRGLTYLLLVTATSPLIVHAQENQEDEPHFPISGFNVVGATLISAEILETRAAPFAGPRQTFSDIESARAAVQEAFIARGYGAVQVMIPEQEITGGHVQLRVVEAKLAEVQVTGNQHFDVANIRYSLPQLREGESPNTVALSRSLALANESPGKQTAVSLATGAQPGEILARVRVEDRKPWSLTLGADNTGSPSTGSARVYTIYRHHNLFNRDQQLAAQYITSPENPSDVKVAGLAYRIPLYELGDSLRLAATYSSVSSGSVAGIDLTGRGNIYSARYIRNLRPEGAYNHHLAFGLDRREYNSGLSLRDSDASLRTRLTTHPLSLTYTGAWRTQANQAGGHVSLVRNIPGGDHGGSDDFAANRTGAEPDYLLLRYGLWYTHVFGNNWSSHLNFDGQYTDDLLTPVEFYGISGINSVRGFHEREASGDTGHRISFELRTPDLAPRLDLERSSLRLAWFIDAAHAERKQTLPGEPGSVSLASTGIGLHHTFADKGHLRMDLANVLKGGGIRRSNSQRLHVSLSWSF
ncbi:ShlB/FhaC/HecB family hemolysin secretion/activation protein [Nitrincola alkalilacustris]|uniref:ShlB/FhaC/HecB family hemolysin secretion/activation protein n=1 Tax=Nitrincola alkalilacustris TaxID=1571224 RepID=UPI00145730B8|nr:ShlB/FhaC/HecB family hemolysin secretion/activation protein [Nitrincola alkalilacustris]